MENRTGVYYQAMPAVGPDGKNVIKLIPVQKVNGKFFQTHVLTTRNDRQPQVYSQPAHVAHLSSPQNKLPILQQTADGRFILKTPSESNTLLSSVKSQHQGAAGLLKNIASQVSVSAVTPKLTPNTLQLPLQNNGKSLTVINSPQQPVAVQSQIIPNGHYLQIPPNATVRTLPASALPQSVKNQICHSLNAPSSPANNLSTVVYVSPVNSLKLGPNQQLPGLAKAGGPSQSSARTPSTSSVRSLNVSSTSSPKPGQETPTAPIKWVVKEGEGSAAPCLIPVASPNMSTDILKAVKQLETVRQMNQVIAGGPTSTQTTEERIIPGNDNALVMCNGKVYFVAKKNAEAAKDVISQPPVRTSVQSSAVGESYTSNMVSKQDKAKKAPVSEKPNEIIDLCDDDEESSTCVTSSVLTVPSGTASENDEDSNVIFVSYIPPKSETVSSKTGSETAPQNSCEKDAENSECSAENLETSCQSTDSPVSDFQVSRCQDNAAADESLKGGGAASDQPEEVCDQVTEATEKILVDSVSLCQQDSKADSQLCLEKPVLEEANQRKSDSELRQIFGITSDLRIRLQRMNQTKESSQQADTRSVNKRTLEGIRKLIQGSQIELKINKLIRAQVPNKESDDMDAKRKCLEEDREKFGTYLDSSFSQSKDTGSCNEMPVMSTDPCIDINTLKCCHGPDVEPHTSSGSSAAARKTHCYSLSSCQPLEAHSDSTACSSVCRKTPARQSKGSGRVCTVCPCGTKVGALTAHLSSKPEEKQNSPTGNSSKQASVLPQSGMESNRVKKVLENSVPGALKSSESRDAIVHSSQTCTKPVKCSVQIAASLKQQVGIIPPELSSTCSSSKNYTQAKTCEKVTDGHEEATLHQPTYSKQADVKSPPSSTERLNINEKAPSEFYSSIMLDPEEIERRERIKRLKDLLKEKEAALEKLRQSM